MFINPFVEIQPVNSSILAVYGYSYIANASVIGARVAYQMLCWQIKTSDMLVNMHAHTENI